MASGGALGSRPSGPMEPDDVTALTKELGLQEEDLNDVVFDEKEAPAEAAS